MASPRQTSDSPKAVGGRPENYKGPDEVVLKVFTDNLGAIIRNRPKKTAETVIFADVTAAKSQADALRPYLPFLMELATIEGHWRFGGPYQIKILLQWNTTRSFVPKHGSRAWAREEVAKLWHMQQLLDQAAMADDRWAALVGDVNKFPIPENRHKSKVTDSTGNQSNGSEANADKISPEPPAIAAGDDASDKAPVDDVTEAPSKCARAHTAVSDGKLETLPKWMLTDMTRMSYEADTSDSDADDGVPVGNMTGPPSASGMPASSAHPTAAMPSMTATEADGLQLASTATQADSPKPAAPATTNTPKPAVAAPAAKPGPQASNTSARVVMDGGMPCTTTPAGLVIFGEIASYPSDDGMALALFPGMKEPIEIPGMVFPSTVRKRPAAAIIKRPAADCAKKQNTGDAGDTVGAGDNEEGGDEGEPDAEDDGDDGADGDDGGEPDAEDEGGEEEEKEDDPEEGPEDDAGGDGGVDADAASEAVKPLRPLQHFLLNRPEGVRVKDRHDEWKRMSAQAKSAYTNSTKEVRGVS